MPALETRVRRVTEGRVVFVLTATAYLALAAVLVFHFHFLDGDALSRVANAYYMEFSRDPKLAAIGFVWTPLPSLLLAPFIPLHLLWAPLTTLGFLGNIESALAMAGAVSVGLGVLRDLGLSRWPRLALTAVFALQPMILQFGANGMSEALELLTMLLVVRSLLAWFDNRSTSHLVRVGLFLALAYLTRYEGLAVGAGVIAMVGIASWLRARQFTDRVVSTGEHQSENVLCTPLQAATADMAVVGAPFVAAVGAWAILSWAIVGHPFETLTSRYGNSAQVTSQQATIANLTHHQLGHTLGFLATQLVAVAPGLPLLLAAVVLIAWRSRQPQLLAPVVVLGGVLVFQWATFVHGTGFGWLRFQITAIPLTLLLAGVVVAEAGRRTMIRAVILVAATCSLAAGFPATLIALSNANVSRGEYEAMRPVVEQIVGSTTAPQLLGAHQGERQVANYLDRLSLPDGSVLADVGIAFPVVLASSRPRQFVITTDRDFYKAVAHPASYRIRYILVSSSPGGLDVVQAVYPTIYATGAGIGHLVRTFPAPQGLAESWRLYAIDTPDSPTATASSMP